MEAPWEKNGQTYYREADGSLWLAESFLNTETQEVISTASFVEPARIRLNKQGNRSGN